MSNKIILQILFGIYNFFFGVLTVYILLYAGIYLNGMVIPDSLRWNNQVLIKSPNWGDAILIMMLILEGVIFMYILYMINKRFLKGILNAKDYKADAKKATLVISIIPFLFIIMCLYMLKVESSSPF